MANVFVQNVTRTQRFGYLQFCIHIAYITICLSTLLPPKLELEFVGTFKRSTDLNPLE